MTTFEKLYRKLPEGFHDCEIASVTVDYVTRTAQLGMNLLVGVGTPTSPNKNLYRSGRLSVTGLLLFCIEPPDPKYPFVLDGRPLSVDGDLVKVGQAGMVKPMLSRLTPDATAYRFFMDEWNSFVYIAGANVEFSWDDDGTGGPDPMTLSALSSK